MRLAGSEASGEFPLLGLGVASVRVVGKCQRAFHESLSAHVVICVARDISANAGGAGGARGASGQSDCVIVRPSDQWQRFNMTSGESPQSVATLREQRVMQSREAASRPPSEFGKCVRHLLQYSLLHPISHSHRWQSFDSFR